MMADGIMMDGKETRYVTVDFPDSESDSVSEGCALTNSHDFKSHVYAFNAMGQSSFIR
jgi:hypothetical protein